MPDKLVVRDIIEGIPIYKFYKNNRQAIDEYLAMAHPMMQEHIEQGKVNQPFCFVLDVSESGMYPINYMIQRIQVLFAEFDQVPENYIAYIVSNHNDTALVKMMDGITARNLAHTRRLFAENKLDDAINWLKDVIQNAE